MAHLRAAFLAVVLLWSGDAIGQSRCDTRASLLDMLAREYQEAPVAVGVTSAGGLVEVFATDDGATWTIVVTTPQGRSCMVAAGEGWRAVPWTEAEPET